MIWLTSDWHFCHDRDFLYKPRGFDNVYDMNIAIIQNHNAIVQPNDDVYCLGDCMLNDDKGGLSCIKSLKGKIHIIRGNHDTDNRIEMYKACYNVVEICDIKTLKYNKHWRFYLSHYPTLTANFDDIKRSPLINLCGHRHTKDPLIDMDKGLIYHVELDAHYNFPIALDTIVETLQKQVLK